ncbi:MAG: 16S rRNA (uracil(1498)-N(3))-methyltransferase [Ruaniaceae bacterium]|nr:16S rRNA (uracil(1498)-N(3))-methyltransferase [Ruaniaceae bacterium]
MTAPVFLTDLRGSRPGDSITVEGPEAAHAHVMRIAAGARIDLVDGAGLRARCTAASVDRERLIAHVEEVRPDDDGGPQIILVQSLTKHGGDEDAIARATECGADAVIPWAADRSIAKWPAAKAERAAAKWRTALLAAMKQSRRARLPQLHPLVTSTALPQRVVAATAAGATVLVLHESATVPLHRAEMTGEVWIVVGPEGGISDQELQAFTQAGATLVRAGQPVMRASTAGAIGVSHAARGLGRWEIVD